MTIEQLIDLAFSAPRRWMNCGRTVTSVAFSLILVGLVAKVAASGVAALSALSSGRHPPPDLALLLPSMPTWWVPETAAGFTLCAVLLAGGVLAVYHGRQLNRIMEA